MSYTKTALIGAMALSSVLAFSSVAYAENQSEARRSDDRVTVGTTTAREQEDENEQADSQATSTRKGRGDDNRSEIAKHVRALLELADREGGIGQEVREIAHEYASSTDRVEKAKKNLEDRPKWKSILVGTDYKNIGELRSEIVTTERQIQRLTKVRDRSTSSTTQSELDTQISALKNAASSTEAFVRAHEDSFSVFGWFVKWFK